MAAKRRDTWTRSLGVWVVTALASLAAPDPPPPGVTVIDGRLSKEGTRIRAIGVNYCDLFQSLIKHPDDPRTLEGLRFLGRKTIPFARFWSCGFWPSDWDLYFTDKQEWFRRMDRVVRTAETAGVGLVPSLFWRTQTYPDLFDEYQDAWGDANSRTHAFMRAYTREVVTRYRDSPAIWGWEFCNEMNLDCDLPNGMELIELRIPDLKVNVTKHERNLMTYALAAEAFKAFASEVRKHDPYRFVTTGNSILRESSWHNAKEKSWVHDDAQQAFEILEWTMPQPMNVLSMHFYPKHGRPPVYAGATGIGNVLNLWRSFATRLGTPLFVGEFSGSAHDKRESLTMTQFRTQQTAILDAIVAADIDLAAYWVFDHTADRKGPGLVRADNEYAWVLDQIVEINRRR